MVNFLLSTRHKNLFSSGFRANHREWTKARRLRTFLRLFPGSRCVESVLLLEPIPTYIKVVRHRLEKTIAGRSFVIEVTWVAEKRWRAHIVRIPGVPTAMMPFYGETPDEAAAHLSKWLDRAHQHQANPVNTV
jgi:hypothetical protein